MGRSTDGVMPESASAQAAPSTIPERPVFVAEHGRRALVMRFVARTAAALAGLWLVGLLAGAFGFGRLPAVPFPPIGALHGQTAAAPDRAPSKGGGASSGLGASELPGANSEGALRTGLSRDRPARRDPRDSLGRSRPTHQPTRSAPGQSPASGSPLTTSPVTPTTPRRSEHAPTSTPSGNPVPAGPTSPGATDQMPPNASGWWRKQ